MLGGDPTVVLNRTLRASGALTGDGDGVAATDSTGSSVFDALIPPPPRLRRPLPGVGFVYGESKSEGGAQWRHLHESRVPLAGCGDGGGSSSMLHVEQHSAVLLPVDDSLYLSARELFRKHGCDVWRAI